MFAQDFDTKNDEHSTSERFNFIATVSVDYPAAGGRPTLFYISVTNGDLEEIVTLSYGKEGEA